MNKQALGLIAALIIIVGGFYGYSKILKNPAEVAVQNPAVQNGNSSQVESTNPNAKKMAFSEFIKQGGSYSCTVNQSVSNIDSTGTVYLDNGKIAGEFVTDMQGSKISSNFVMKDGYSYFWSSAAPTMGFKVAINQSSGASSANTFNAEQIGDYKCETWVAEASKFEVSSSVKFTEMKN